MTRHVGKANGPPLRIHGAATGSATRTPGAAVRSDPPTRSAADAPLATIIDRPHSRNRAIRTTLGS